MTTHTPPGSTDRIAKTTRRTLSVAIACAVFVLAGAASAQQPAQQPKKDASTQTTVPAAAQRVPSAPTSSAEAAQDRPSAAQPSSAGAAAHASLNAADRKFLEQAMHSSNAEVVLGELAARKAASDEVREFGRMMQQDHSKAHDDLMALHPAHAGSKPAAAAGTARSADAAAASGTAGGSMAGSRTASAHAVHAPGDRAQLTAEQRQVVERLEKLQGAAFDAAYADQMVAMHRKDVEMFEKAAKDQAHSAAVRQAAERKLPTLREHLRSAQALEQQTASVDED